MEEYIKGDNTLQNMLLEQEKKEEITQKQIKVEPIDKIMLIGNAILALVATECMFYGGFGIGFVITVLAYLGCHFYYCKYTKVATSQCAKRLMIPIILTTLCFLLFNNMLLKFFNFLFLVGLLLMHGVATFKTKEDLLNGYWLKKVMAYSFTLPFYDVDKPFVVLKQYTNEGKKKKFTVLGKVALGIIIGLPFLIMMLNILMSADTAFAAVSHLIMDRFNSIETNWSIGRGIIFVILFFLGYSYFYGLIHREEQIAQQGVIASTERTKIKLDFVMVATFMTLLSLLYVGYCLSQLVYLVSAFRSILPEGYSLAEYARSGFFESQPIALFNLGVIMVFGMATRTDTPGKKKYATAIISFITGFTFFIIICALSKMVLYMRTYGLTLKRVYVAWFLVLMIFVILIFFVKVVFNKIHLVKMLFIVFTTMYLGLNYANADYFIAKYNVKLYETGVVDEFSGCYDLSAIALVPLEPYIDNHNGSAEDILSYHHRLKEEIKWQKWNVSDYLARQAIN